MNNGGRLVAMRPDAQLDGVLGISRPPLAPVTDGYLLVNQSGPGAGLQDITLPFKGQADLYTLAGGTAVADLYTTRTLSANRPAVVKFGRTAAWSFRSRPEHRLCASGRSGVRRARPRRLRM